MIYALILWTAVASSNYGTKYDWRELSRGFTQESHCVEVAGKLGVKQSDFRCIVIK